MFIPKTKQEARLFKEVMTGRNKGSSLIEIIHSIKEGNRNWQQTLIAFLKRKEVQVTFADNEELYISFIGRRKKVLTKSFMEM